MKDKSKGLVIAAIIGLGLWSWQEGKAIAGFDPWNYDLDGDRRISQQEVLKAVSDYYDDKITKEQVDQVRMLYETQIEKSTAKPIAGAAAVPLEATITQPGAGQIVVETNRSPTIPETIEIASQIIETYPDVVTVTLPSWTGEGEAHYDAPSIVQAAQMSGMSTEAWIALYGYGVTQCK